MEKNGKHWKTAFISTGKDWKMAKKQLENTGMGTPPEGGHPAHFEHQIYFYFHALYIA